MMTPEERRHLCIEALESYLNESGLFTEKTRILLRMLFENVLFPPMPEMPTAIAYPFPVATKAWHKEEAKGAHIYLNVMALWNRAAEFRIHPGGVAEVTVEDDRGGAEWNLAGTTAEAFLQLAGLNGVFDGDDELLPEAAAARDHRDQAVASMQAQMRGFAQGHYRGDIPKKSSCHCTGGVIDPDCQEHGQAASE